MLFDVVKGIAFVVAIVWGGYLIKKTVGIEKFRGRENFEGSRRGFQNYIFSAPFHTPNTRDYYYTNVGHLFPFEMQEIKLSRSDMSELSDMEMKRYFDCNYINTPYDGGKCSTYR